MTNLWSISQQPWQKRPLVRRWIGFNAWTANKLDLPTLAKDSMAGIMSDIELASMSSSGLCGGERSR